MSTIVRSLDKSARVLVILASLVLAGVLVWQGITSSGAPDPTAAHIGEQAAVVDTAILVFREGLECILVLAAITASFVGANQLYRRPVALGAGLGSAATIATWFIAIAVLDRIDAPALDLQAATGLLAVVVLLVVMNWFFHRVYWTGWISMHNRRRRELVAQVNAGGAMGANVMRGFALLGFASVYREGVEVVLFLQSIRLQVGSTIVLAGVALGLTFTAVVGVLTFAAHHRLPYKRMLVLTGVMLGVVLVVMVGESVQEMQLAGWLRTTPIALPIPDWMGLWFAIFPNVENLVAQFLAALVVLGSYFAAQYLLVWRPRRRGETPAERAADPPTVPA
ncbi:MAG: FTR1 family protein [Chloroflexi bacterium]|nr:FTR1 family protein [Chloroflexota bacterium]